MNRKTRNKLKVISDELKRQNVATIIITKNGPEKQFAIIHGNSAAISQLLTTQCGYDADFYRVMKYVVEQFTEMPDGHPLKDGPLKKV